MNSSVVEFIRIVSNLSIIAPLVLYFSKFKIASKPAHIIGALLIVSGLCDLVGFILMKGKHSTATVFNLYYVLTFILLSWYYYESIFKKRYKTVLLAGSVVYFVCFMLITFTMQDIFQHQSRVWILDSIILMIYALIYGAYLHTKTPYVDDQGAVCFNAAIFFYFTWNIGIFILSAYLFDRLDPTSTLAVWSVHNISNIAKNIFMAVGFYIIEKRN